MPTRLTEDEPVSFARVGIVLLVLALCAFALQGWWILKGDPKPGWFSDSIDYLILANFFHGHFSGDTSPLSLSIFGTSRFPPLFPLTLALAGAGTRSWITAYWICLANGLSSIACTYLWFRQQTRSSLIAGALLPLAVVSPQFFLLHLEVLSESQFVLIMALSLWVLTKYEEGRASLLILALLTSLLPLSRTAGVAMLFAITIWMIFYDRRSGLRDRIVAGAMMWVPAMAWLAYRKHLPIAHGYVDDLVKVHVFELSTWLTLFTPNHIFHMIGGFAAWFDLVGGLFTRIVVSGLLIIAGWGWWLRFRNWRVDAIFISIYLALVFVWPYPVETTRLLAVSMPVVALYFYCGTKYFLNKAYEANPRRASIAAAATMIGVCCILSGSTWVDIVRRTNMDMDPELASARRTFMFFVVQPPDSATYVAEVITAISELSKAIPSVVPPKDCVWTSYESVSAFLSGFGFIPRRTPLGIVDAESAKHLLSECRYLLTASIVSPQTPIPPLYPLQQINAFANPVLVSYATYKGKRQIAAALVELHQ